MKKTLLALLILTFLASGSGVVLAKDHDDDHDSRSCKTTCQKSVKERENAVVKALDKYTKGLKCALEERKEGLLKACKKSDKEERNEAIAKVMARYNDKKQDLKEDFEDRIQDANERFEHRMKNCTCFEDDDFRSESFFR